MTLILSMATAFWAGNMLAHQNPSTLYVMTVSILIAIIGSIK
jgi:hypothetical protein